MLFSDAIGNYSVMLWQEQVTIWWNDDDVHILLVHWQNSPVSYVVPTSNIILTLNQPDFALTPQCCVLIEKTVNTISKCSNQNCYSLLVGLMEFNANFNNISVISWRSVLLVEETGVPRENHLPVASHWHTFVLFLLAIVLSILTNSDYPFVIFKLFLSQSWYDVCT